MITINKRKLITALLTLFLLTIIILLISYFFITQKKLIGPVLIILGFLSLLPLRLFNIPTEILKAEIIFGIIDNGVLAIFALSGAELFGILGAIIGSLVGNAITDGFAGIFEGYEWNKISELNLKGKRTILTVSLGKLSGCLLGGGVILTIAWSILNFM
ncbi:hypothetical protein HYX11_01745 [Candidatus Woesearchaeota archaeon]|nr:hypothetical protein [Candidatus Woesearchaeota archaeon]